MATSDEAQAKIAQGWKLSNAYQAPDRGPGNLWHNVKYDAEIRNGNYTHMALVPDPRYGESIILTPEEFAAYNSKLEAERSQFQNSKGGLMKGIAKVVDGVLKFFNSADTPSDKALEVQNQLAGIKFDLKNGRSLTIVELVNEAEKEKEKDDENAHDHHMVNMGDGKPGMKVSAMRAHYNELLMAHEKTKAEELAKEQEHTNAISALKAEHEKALVAAKAGTTTEVQNAVDAAVAKAKAEHEAAQKAADDKKKNYDELLNARGGAGAANEVVIDLPAVNGVARGREMFG